MIAFFIGLVQANVISITDTNRILPDGCWSEDQ